MAGKAPRDFRRAVGFWFTVIGGSLAIFFGYLGAFPVYKSEFTKHVFDTLTLILTTVIIIRLIFLIAKSSDENQKLLQASAALLTQRDALSTQLSDLKQEVDRQAASFSVRLDDIRHGIEENQRLINSKFSLMAETRFLLVRSLAKYQARERGLYRRYVKPNQLEFIQESLRELRLELHNARLISLSKICNTVSALFSHVKGTEVHANVKFLLWSGLDGNQVTPRSKYVTIARSDNTPAERSSLYDEGDKFKEYFVSTNSMLMDAIKDPSLGYLKIDDVVSYVESKSQRDHKFEWPNRRSIRFYRSALLVPIWHNLPDEFGTAELTTMLGNNALKPFHLYKDGIDHTCYGFIIVDSKGTKVFNDNDDVNILNECALTIFSNFFEQFSIQFVDEGA
jgi:hypothetical protein